MIFKWEFWSEAKFLNSSLNDDESAFYMNKMRLTRDKKWYFENYPYHQMRMDNELLSGWVSIIYLVLCQDLVQIKMRGSAS